MKNKYLIIVFAIISFSFFGCEDEDKKVIPDFVNGIKPKVITNSDLDMFFDYYDIDKAVIGFSVDIYRGDPASLEVVGQYNDGAPVVFGEVTNWPQDFKFTTAELVAAFPEIVASDSLSIGDSFKFSVGATLKDGTKLSSVVAIPQGDEIKYYYGYGVDIGVDVGVGGYDVIAEYDVSCSSSIGGTYTVTSTGSNTWGGCGVIDATVENLEVELKPIGGGKYELADITCGMYPAWYACDDAGKPVVGNLIDKCGDITLQGTGNYDEKIFHQEKGFIDENGVITIKWTNDWGDKATSVFTPKK